MFEKREFDALPDDLAARVQSHREALVELLTPGAVDHGPLFAAYTTKERQLLEGCSPSVVDQIDRAKVTFARLGGLELFDVQPDTEPDGDDGS